VVTVRGDRYILRRPSPGETIGGGTVVDPQPKLRHKRFDQTVIHSLEAMAHGSPSDILLQACASLGPASVKDAVTRARLESPEAAAALRELTASGQLVVLENGDLSPSADNLIIGVAQWLSLKETTMVALTTYHRLFPLRRGMPREELKSKLKLSARVFNPFITSLVAHHLLMENGALVASPGHEIRFDSLQQAAIKKLTTKFAAAPFTPPTVKECQAEVGEEVLAALLELGNFMAVSDEVIFRREDYEKMVAQIRQVIQIKGSITVADVRDHFDTSRRYALALMEHLDAAGVTLREGDVRTLRK